MRTIDLVTHPEARHHVAGLVGGWYDSELTPLGLRSGAAIGAALRALVPAGDDVEVSSSDLQRTRQTAEAIGSALGTCVVLDPGGGPAGRLLNISVVTQQPEGEQFRARDPFYLT